MLGSLCTGCGAQSCSALWPSERKCCPGCSHQALFRVRMRDRARTEQTLEAPSASAAAERYVVERGKLSTGAVFFVEVLAERWATFIVHVLVVARTCVMIETSEPDGPLWSARP